MAEVIILTGLGSRELGVEALREGALRYFTKQSENDEELICALMVAYDIAREKRATSRWKKTGEQLNSSLRLIIGVAGSALACVTVLNFVASENFFASLVEGRRTRNRIAIWRVWDSAVQDDLGGRRKNWGT